MFGALNDARPVSATHHSRLVISEVHPAADASKDSTEAHEWVEIHNLGPGAADLSGWFLEDAQAIAALPDFILPAGTSAVIVGRSATISVPAGETLLILETRRIGSGLRNTGDRVALINPYGVRYDAVSWGDVRTPRQMEPPDPRQSIVRTPRAGQRLSDVSTPWTNDHVIDVRPERHAHPRPDTRVRIVAARLDRTEQHPESVTIRNISDQPLLTINWRLTVGASSVAVRSVRINPGELYTITEPDGELGSGLSRNGGHFVLRDAEGNWLSTASWGDDKTFHDQAAPGPREEIRFNPLARVYPRVPWHERFDHMGRMFVDDQHQRHSLTHLNAVQSSNRFGRSITVRQESTQESIWISEVYPAAGQGRNDAAYEWFEITNSGDVPVDLTGWTIADNRASDPLDRLGIPPQSSVVVAGSNQAAPTVSLHISDGRIGNGLANAGDRLTLINPDGDVISAISWGNDRTHANIKSPNPEESIHWSSPTAEPAIAAPSPGGLTASPQLGGSSTVADQVAASDATQGSAEDSPTAPVEQTTEAPQQADLADNPPNLRITELLPAPLPGEAEWVELFNPSDREIDLTGWTIGDLTRRTPLSGSIPAGSHLIVANLDIQASAAVLVVDRIGNNLNNDADTITLHDPQGVARFTVQYGTADVPAPGPGLSIAVAPERWVVTAEASPGSEDVTPLLDDAFRAPTVKRPAPENDRLPLVAEPMNEGLNAWMIVSFALIGVILTLIVRRWQPEREPIEERTGGAQYTGQPAESSKPPEPVENGDNRVE